MSWAQCHCTHNGCTFSLSHSWSDTCVFPPRAGTRQPHWASDGIYSASSTWLRVAFPWLPAAQRLSPCFLKPPPAALKCSWWLCEVPSASGLLVGPGASSGLSQLPRGREGVAVQGLGPRLPSVPSWRVLACSKLPAEL